MTLLPVACSLIFHSQWTQTIVLQNSVDNRVFWIQKALRQG